MKLFFLSLVGLLFVSQVWALDPQKLYGTYIWGHNVYLNETHKWENGLWQTSEGQARMAELKKSGYNCYRRSPRQFTCHWKSKNEQLPADVEKFAADYVKNFKAEFRGPFDEPKDMINTSTEREWWVGGDVWVNGSHVTGYKWTHSFEHDQNFVVLPVNDEQPIPWFLFHSSELLHLPLQVQQKDGPDRKTQFMLEVNLVQSETH
jgi:hypothetical protein